LLSTFWVDGPTLGFTGGDLSKAEALFRAFVVASLVGGEVHVASFGDEPIAGVSTWFPPGRALLDSDEQHKGGFDAYMENLDAPTRDWWNNEVRACLTIV
jgi:hypothetical protein